MSNLYKKLAEYYDLLYDFKDYEGEAEEVKALVDKYKESGGSKLLDVGCGTGAHLEHLKEGFECTGVDLNGEMLDVARNKFPEIVFHRQDMADLDLDDRFDVIICLFSSIAYVKTYGNLEKTLSRFAEHLKPGGVVIIEPWFEKESFEKDTAHMTTGSGEGVNISRLGYNTIEDGKAVLTFQYLISEDGKGIQHLGPDRHELGFFKKDKVLKIMEEKGLDAFCEEESLPRSAYVGVKER